MDLVSHPVVIVSLLTLVIASACVLLHYEGLSILSEQLPRLGLPRRPRVLLLIFAILFLHSVEIFLFGLGYFWLLQDTIYGTLQGPAPLDLIDCGYYSAVVFTTLGLGDIIPHGAVRVLTGPESLTGFVLITWSASFTFLEMQRFWKPA
ncbi:MAG: potassium channel family protein [Steroidobacteraceae bacterium]